jgi:hypothetical protein
MTPRAWLLLLFLPAFLLLSTPPVWGTSFSSYRVAVDLSGDGAIENLVIGLRNDGPQPLTSAFVTIPGDAEVLSVRDTYGPLPYTTEAGAYLRLQFRFPLPVEPGGERLVLIELRTHSLVTEKKEYSEYLLVFTPREDLPDFEHVLRLPPGSEFYSPRKSFQAVFPEAEVTSQEGRITLIWRKALSADRPEVFLVRFRHSSGFRWGDLGLFLLLFLLAVLLGFLASRAVLFYRKKRFVQSLRFLNERERAILEAVVLREGIRQQELQERLGYTKSSLSKLLDRLEARGLVRRKRFGKVNRLYPGEKAR